MMLNGYHQLTDRFPMQSNQIENALKDFVCHQERRAVVLKGDWGVGKTYLWRRAFENNKNKIIAKKYSYVSLFGLGSLKDLKRSIFENSIDIKSADKSINSQNTLIDNLQLIYDKSGSGFRKYFNLGEKIKLPFVGDLSSVVDSVQFSMINDTLICIDDFERRSPSLSTRDVLGLISLLVESKNCSVVLILNQTSLKPDDEFPSFSEKVFDYEICYSPTPSETAKLVFTETKYTHLIQNTTKLNINNIRLLKKTKIFYDSIYPQLVDAPAEVQESAAKIIPLCVFSIFGGEKCPVDISFIEKYDYGYSILPEQPETPESKTRLERIQFLQDYGLPISDEFTLELSNAIKNGFPNKENISKVINELKIRIQHFHDTQLLAAAWQELENNFEGTKAGLASTFKKAIDSCLENLNLNDLNSLGWLYAELGIESEFTNYIDKYFTLERTKRRFTDREEIFNWPQNNYLSQKLEEHFSLLERSRPLDELLISCCAENNFSSKTLTPLTKASPSELSDILIKINGPELIKYIRRLLDCGKAYPYDKQALSLYRTMFLNTWKALEIIGQRSDLNKLRVSRFFYSYSDTYQLVTEQMASEETSPAE